MNEVIVGNLTKPLSNPAKYTRNEALLWLARQEYYYGEIRQGLWEDALDIAEGDETTVRCVYLKLRVESLQNDLEALHSASGDPEIKEADLRKFSFFHARQNENQQKLRLTDDCEGHSGICSSGINLAIGIFAIFSLIILVALFTSVIP